ncbi:type I restriction endonuclease subunit R, EcoR124 family, partial [Vibrio anguillarum]
FFWEKEKREALESMATEENLDTDKLEILVNRYELSEEMPLRDDFAGTLQTKPTILQRKKIVGRLTEKFKGFVDTFIGGF